MWSADGQGIFYMRWDKDTKTSRYVLRDLETGKEKDVHREPARGSLRDMALSSDGTMLALCRSNKLSVVPAAGGQPRDLVTVPRLQDQKEGEAVQIASVAWMPGDRFLVFTMGSPSDELELWRVGVEGGEPEKNSDSPRNSSDGSASACTPTATESPTTRPRVANTRQKSGLWKTSCRS